MQVGRLLAGEEKGYDFAGFSGRHLLLQPSPAISSEKPPGFWGGGGPGEAVNQVRWAIGIGPSTVM